MQALDFGVMIDSYSPPSPLYPHGRPPIALAPSWLPFVAGSGKIRVGLGTFTGFSFKSIPVMALS
jgi:hypothetical protein